MNAADTLRLAGGALAKERRRSSLSLLGVAIGVAAVLLLTALGEGARGYVLAQFRSLGTDLIGVLPGKVETTGGIPGFGGVPNDLTLADAEAVQRSVRGVRRVVPIVVGSDVASRGDRARDAVVVGSTPEFLEIRHLEVQAGRFLPELPWERAEPVAVLGPRIARELFPGESPLGGRIRIGAFRMRVVGTLKSEGVHFGMDMDDIVVVPVTTAMQMFDRTSLFRIAIEVRPGSSIAEVEDRVRSRLVERHGEEDFTVTTPDAILGSLSSILNALTLALAGIAAISLSVAGIGIMNVMLVSVSERTAEIGLCKAVGASSSQLMGLFVTEAILLAALGGALGVVLGTGGAELARALYPSFPVRVPWWAVASGLGVSLAVGAVFGLLPARRAVRLDPVLALSRR